MLLKILEIKPVNFLKTLFGDFHVYRGEEETFHKVKI